MIRALGVLLLLVGCASDETISGFAGVGSEWRYEGSETAQVTLAFPGPGQVAGQGPCNRYFATQSAPYPWFELGPIASTKMACPNLSEEATYLAKLAAMTLAEVSGDVLILSNDAGEKMIFARMPDSESDG
ncbi:META domain-containing protein [Shimia ponticola]|uniref:META domain-containing protein n=1 Tax=Shimia ponticola TaxID=2582893 RepID=UPI0011BDE401|nr:META domain-containing protein [Shimia ponticola]